MSTNRYQYLPIEVRRDGKICLWKYEKVSGRMSKVPYQINGKKAKSNDVNSFTSYDEAISHLEGYDGISLGVFEPFFAIDIDHCVVDGQLTEAAKNIVEIISSYTEFSPSGEGIRIIGGIKDFNYNRDRYYIHNSKLGIEIYVGGCTNKVVTMTGNTLEKYRFQYKEIQHIDLQKILDKYMLKPNSITVRKIEDVPGSILSDEEVIDRAKKSKNGNKFEKLWDGTFARAKTGVSQQEYDLALCSTLAFWCGGDMEQMDRLFRQSGLFREKWEREDYRKATLEKAVMGCDSFYQRKERYISEEVTDVLELVAGIDPANNPRYTTDDLGFGRLYADVFKDSVRYVPERKKWYVYDGKRWKPDEGSLKSMEFCKTLADSLLVYISTIESQNVKSEWLDKCRRWCNRRSRETFLKDAQSVYPISMSEFDADKYLFNCDNGTLDLRTREFRPHSPQDKLTKISPVEYDPYAKNARWIKFIEEVMSNDTERALFLQKALGYGITGDTRYECMFFLYGETTRNGKGTLMESILNVAGDYGKATRAETIAQKPNVNSQGPSEDIARLAGIRLANISEPSRGLLLNTAQVKSMTGNDTLNARFLNENSFDFKPQFKLYVNTNYLPVINDTTLFSSGRVMVIPFDRHFEEWEQDRTLKEDFRKPESKSAILNWLVDGFTMLEEEGFNQPESVKNAIKEYEQESNKTSQFVDECLVSVHFSNKIRTATVYTAYTMWCERNGYHAEGNRNFMHELRKLIKVERKRPSDGGNKTTIIEGYRFSGDYEFLNKDDD